MNFSLSNGVLRLAVCMLALDVCTFLGYGDSSILVSAEDRPTARCKYTKAASLLQVDCTSKNFENVPATLNTNSQVLVLTFNRLTELQKGSFTPYTSLEYLYLGKNFITEITNDTVEELKYLQALDLSKNLLTDLPSNIFQLPYLRRLYLTGNKLKDDAFKSEVKSPLQFLEVAYNDLTKVPSIGLVPGLTSLNLSYNAIRHISTEDVAPFCLLKVLDLTKNSIEFNPEKCDCQLFNSWARIRNLKVIPSFPCNNNTFESCNRASFSNNTIDSFERCLNIIKDQEAAVKAKTTWIIVASCISVFLVCLIIGFYCRHKRNKKRDQKSKEEQRLAANNANTELLNGNLPDQLPIKTSSHE